MDAIRYQRFYMVCHERIQVATRIQKNHFHNLKQRLKAWQFNNRNNTCDGEIVTIKGQQYKLQLV